MTAHHRDRKYSLDELHRYCSVKGFPTEANACKNYLRRKARKKGRD